MQPVKPWNLRDRTFAFARDTTVFCSNLAKRPGTERAIASQLLRAATSVGANVEEAHAAYSRREFACKNCTVLKEAREAHYWLRLLVATGLAASDTVTPLLSEADELVAIYTTIVRRAKSPSRSQKAEIGSQNSEF